MPAAAPGYWECDDCGAVLEESTDECWRCAKKEQSALDEWEGGDST